ncbi:MAG: hypothetical protein IKZ41_02955 [Clostridia bacterium]|nr:hypothetical protein [Clostridia bacterium]MBR5366031.1 hypothetical protein [Clostridia bacterium]
MKQEFREMLDAMHRYNRGSLAKDFFGLDPDERYDLLVVAPSWLPAKIFSEVRVLVSPRAEHAVMKGYHLYWINKKIAWIVCGNGASNLIDALAVCGELDFRRMLFVDSAGSLVPEYKVGDFCTPSQAVSGVGADAYLGRRLADYELFRRVTPYDPAFVDRVIGLAREAGHSLQKASVFSSDSIVLEYRHLDEIRAFGTDLIEMETASFYLLADLLEKPAAALLAVSDNLADGSPLAGRSDEERAPYDRTRFRAVPETILKVAAMED